ncbi:DUF6514 family protein [uncultured Flavonifractor sp.]|uniref:DUF6514 family protein n=1 Tax=uncultured Flavonifractor sp. TaxID=1193534 RepID=UPI002637F5C6|nr:DUF6514 family protein [uncultured Flavonifractor sp.]
MRELLVGSCQAMDEEGRTHGYRYYILVGEMPVGGLTCESYGVKIVGENGDQASVENLTIRTERIDRLMELLIRNAVSPVALRDVIDDWL